MESESVVATRVLLEKSYGIWEGLAACQMNLITLNARRILPEKTPGFWAGWYETIFSCKTHGIREHLAACHIDYNQNERQVHFV